MIYLLEYKFLFVMSSTIYQTCVLPVKSPILNFYNLILIFPASPSPGVFLNSASPPIKLFWAWNVFNLHICYFYIYKG